MILYKNNKEKFEIDDLEVILKFYESDIFKNKQLDEDVRFALFLAYDPPNGYGSTAGKDEFNRMYELVKENKWRRIKDIPPEMLRK